MRKLLYTADMITRINVTQLAAEIGVSRETLYTQIGIFSAMSPAAAAERLDAYATRARDEAKSHITRAENYEKWARILRGETAVT